VDNSASSCHKCLKVAEDGMRVLSTVGSWTDRSVYRVTIFDLRSHIESTCLCILDAASEHPFDHQLVVGEGLSDPFETRSSTDVFEGCHDDAPVSNARSINLELLSTMLSQTRKHDLRLQNNCLTPESQ
jgi:hypothetical protein